MFLQIDFLVRFLLRTFCASLAFSHTKRNTSPKRRAFFIQMPNLEEKLTVLKKKKLTAKTIVEQQRNEIRLLKSTMTINERLEEIYQRFDSKSNLDADLYHRIIRRSNDTVLVNDQVQQTASDLSKLIEQILHVLSLPNEIDLKDQDLRTMVTRQKECFQLIKWKLSDVYADRLADEVSCITS